VIAVILLVLLVVPTVVWFTVRGRPREDAGATVEASGAKHRWWQP
jgi:hypothetical protein